MELTQASKAANEALQLDARNSTLHFLNGFIYHLQARQGDSQKNEMAMEGYQQALRIDPSNWIAQEFLGLAYMDTKKFDQAKGPFSEALLMAPESTVSLYGLMVASYLTGDAVTACGMADQFQKTTTEPHAGFIRSSVLVYASCADFAKADLMREELGKLGSGPIDMQNVDRRLAQWKSFYSRHNSAHAILSSRAGSDRMHTSWNGTTSDAPADRLAQAYPATATSSQANPAPDTASPSSAPHLTEAPDDGSPRMVLVDVVLVSSQELVSTSKGINLLNALTLQFGSSSAPAYSDSRQFDTVTGGADSASSRITRAVTIPALSYSLNIANANNSNNEVLARPTLAAIEGLPSEFFSGTNLSAGVISVSTVGSPSVIPIDKRFGVKLAVTPAFLPNGKIKMKVDAQRTALNTTSENPKVAYQFEIAETIASANVVMQMGDTLVLSGMSERSAANGRDGVPVLQDIPVFQYLFSNRRTNEIQRSVLILITPRTPAYTAQASGSSGTAVSASTQALRQKFGIAGATHSTVEAILNQLTHHDFFREFRQGDVTLDRWDRMHSTGDRLRQALGFLYY